MIEVKDVGLERRENGDQGRSLDTTDSNEPRVESVGSCNAAIFGEGSEFVLS